MNNIREAYAMSFLKNAGDLVKRLLSNEIYLKFFYITTGLATFFIAIYLVLSLILPKPFYTNEYISFIAEVVKVWLMLNIIFVLIICI